MMYSQGRRPLDSVSMSSETTDITSRATTLPESSSDTTLQHQQGINLANIQTEEEDRSSSSVTTTGSVNTVVNKTSDIQKNNNNRVTTQHQQQQPWINPYWGSNGKPPTGSTQVGTNKINNNTNPEYALSSTRDQQLIPGSILINDRGEITNNTHLNSNTSINSFIPGGKYVSDDRGGPGGYLAPTHFQHRIVTPSPGLTVHPANHFDYKRSSSASNADTHIRPEFNRQQTFPKSTTNNTQPWINPYWSKPKQNNSQFTQKDNINQNKTLQSSNDAKQSSWNTPSPGTKPLEKSTSSTRTWKNPYWKDSKPQASTTSKQDQPWKNPYWKDWKPQTSTPSKSNDHTWKNPYWKEVKSELSTIAKKIQPWKNPYWKDWKPQTSTPSKPQDQTRQNSYWKDSKPQTRTTSKQESQPWKNPYWKDLKPQTSTPSKPQDQTWQNPYWKDSKPQTPTTSKQESQPWKNPYWKDWKPQGSPTSSQLQDKTWQNPYWKDKNTSEQGANSTPSNDSLFYEYKDPPIPSFYKRIYPPDTPSSSPVPTVHIKHETILSSGSPKPITDANEDLPYTIDSQGVAHYQAASPLPSSTNKTVNFAFSPTTSQYPVLPPQPPSFMSLPPPHGAIPPSQTPNAPVSSKAPYTSSLSQTTISAPPSFSNNIPSSLFSNLNNYPPSSSFNYSSPTSSSPIILTATELNGIQHALHLFATNPNKIPLVETPNQVPPSNINYPNNLLSPLASLFIENQAQQSRSQPPPPSSFSQNVQFNSPPYAYNSNSQPSILFSTPSYPFDSTEPSRRLNQQGSFVLI